MIKKKNAGKSLRETKKNTAAKTVKKTEKTAVKKAPPVKASGAAAAKKQKGLKPAVKPVGKPVKETKKNLEKKTLKKTEISKAKKSTTVRSAAVRMKNQTGRPEPAAKPLVAPKTEAKKYKEKKTLKKAEMPVVKKAPPVIAAAVRTTDQKEPKRAVKPVDTKNTEGKKNMAAKTLKKAETSEIKKAAVPVRTIKPKEIKHAKNTAEAPKTEAKKNTEKKTLKKNKISTKTPLATIKNNKKTEAKIPGKLKSAKAAAKKTGAAVKEIPLADILKNGKLKKTGTGGKVIVENPMLAKETTSVTSSHVENLYGRHYIIDTAQELPRSYDKSRLTILLRDPEWIYAFWDISDDKIEAIKKSLGPEEFKRAKKILRVYNVDGVENHQDIEISKTASSWYINVKPNLSYSVEYGFRTPEGSFMPAVKSNSVDSPASKISNVVEEKWMVADGEFKKLYDLAGGSKIGASSADIMQVMARGMKPSFASEGISSDVLQLRGGSSEALSSQAMAERSITEEEKTKQRKYWLVLNTELIVYGATEPDSTVTIMDQPVKLREDGTFSIRMMLPDTDVDIPVKGISIDKIDEITITPCVHKHTDFDKKENA